MTCIVGLVDKDDVWIGGDSAGVTNQSFVESRADKKVFRNGEFVMGGAGSFRLLQILQYEFKPPYHASEKDNHHYMVTDFVKKLREVCLRVAYLESDKGVESADGTILVGYRGELFGVFGNSFQIAKYHRPYMAMGSGREVAIGSLYTSLLTRRLYATRDDMHIALDASAEFTAFVRFPYTILKVQETHNV